MIPPLSRNRSDALADQLLARTVLLNRVATGILNEVESIVPLVHGAIITAILNGRRAGLQLQETVRIAFAEVTAVLSETLRADFWLVSASELTFAQKALSIASGGSLPLPIPVVPGLPDLLGVSFDQWLSAIEQDTANKIVSAVNAELATGELSLKPDFLLDVFARLMASLDSLIRTMLHRIQAWAIREVAPRVIYGEFRWIQISVLDSRTSAICRKYAGAIWTMDFEPVGHDLPFKDGTPRHWNCRSIIAPLFPGDSPRPLTFNGWFEALGRQEREKLFGAKLVRLFGRKLVGVGDMVRQAGRPMRVQDLA